MDKKTPRSLAIYTLLTMVLTYPIILKMGSGDAWQILHYFWYTKMTLLDPSPGLSLS